MKIGAYVACFRILADSVNLPCIFFTSITKANLLTSTISLLEIFMVSFLSYKWKERRSFCSASNSWGKEILFDCHLFLPTSSKKAVYFHFLPHGITLYINWVTLPRSWKRWRAWCRRTRAAGRRPCRGVRRGGSPEPSLPHYPRKSLKSFPSLWNYFLVNEMGPRLRDFLT